MPAPDDPGQPPVPRRRVLVHPDDRHGLATGWPTAEMREAQRAEGVELAGLLQTELGDEWLVQLQFWEEESAM